MDIEFITRRVKALIAGLLAGVKVLMFEVVALIASVVAVGSILTTELSMKRLFQASHSEPQHSKALKSLDDTRKSVEDLLAFIDSQRQQLEASRQTLEAMKTEEDKLRPLVDADRKIVKALFAAQESQNQAALTRKGGSA